MYVLFVILSLLMYDIIIHLHALTRDSPKRKNLVIAKSKPFELYYQTQKCTGRGRCVILNYETFNSTTLQKRTWSHMDVDRIRSQFESLNFEVAAYTNLTYMETIHLLQYGM